MFIKDLLVYPFNEILDTLEPNETIVFHFNATWFYFREHPIIVHLRTIEGLFPFFNNGYYHVSVITTNGIDQKMIVNPIGDKSDLVDFWLDYNSKNGADRVLLENIYNQVT